MTSCNIRILQIFREIHRPEEIGHKSIERLKVRLLEVAKYHALPGIVSALHSADIRQYAYLGWAEIAALKYDGFQYSSSEWTGDGGRLNCGCEDGLACSVAR